MSERLFMFLVIGIAIEAAPYRTGARHALMLYAKGPEIASARQAAIAGAESRGWTYIDVQREKETDPDPSIIDDDVLRSAVEQAVKAGTSMVVYEKELPLDG